MKTKTDRLAEAWTPIEKRVPPTTTEEIWYWLPEIKESRVGKALNLHQAALAMMDPERRQYVAWDKRLSHWMKVVPPQGGNR